MNSRKIISLLKFLLILTPGAQAFGPFKQWGSKFIRAAQAYNVQNNDRPAQVMKLAFSGSALVNQGSLIQDGYEAYKNPQPLPVPQLQELPKPVAPFIAQLQKTDYGAKVNSFLREHPSAQYLPLVMTGIALAANTVSFKAIFQTTITKAGLFTRACRKLVGLDLGIE